MARSVFDVRLKVVVGQTPAGRLALMRIAIAMEQLNAGLPFATIAGALDGAYAAALKRARAEG